MVRERESLATARTPVGTGARVLPHGVAGGPGCPLEDGALIAGGEGQGAANLIIGAVADDATFATSSRSLMLVRGALRGDTVVRQLVRDEAGFVRAIRELSARGDSLAELLGTIPHPSNQSIAQTFVRFENDPAAPVVRILWSGGRVAAWSEGIRMPGFGRFRPTSRHAAVAYLAREQGWRTLEFERDARGAVSGLRVMLPNGSRSDLLPRVAPD